MKRSEAIKKLQDYIAAQDQDFNIAEDVLDFIEKEIGMQLPDPKEVKYEMCLKCKSCEEK